MADREGLMGIERRLLPMTVGGVRLEERDGEKPRIEGYAAVFYREDDPGTQYALWDGVVERIMPGAFDRAVAEDDVAGLFNHDPNQLLGRTSSGTLALSTDRRGLQYRIAPDDTTVGRDVQAYLRRGDVTGSSFSFLVTDQAFRQESELEIREIHAVRLFDVGPVVFPAYASTTAGVRAIGQPEEAMAAYRAWQEKRRLARSAARRRRLRIWELDTPIVGG